MAAELFTVIGGFVDTHVHGRDEGEKQKETIETVTQAGAAGGFSTLLFMPNTFPEALDTIQRLTHYKNRARGRAYTDYGVYFKATPENSDQLAAAADYATAFKYYMVHTTNNNRIATESDTRAVLHSMPKDKVLVLHAEEESVPMVFKIAEEEDARVHLAHIESAENVDYLALYKGRRPGKVTGEVTPHHAMLTDRQAELLGGHGMMKPMIRKERDRDAIQDGIKNGIIDMVGTDHAPHRPEDKANFTLENGPYGVAGLEISFKVMLQGIEKGFIHDLAHLQQLMQVNPAIIFGIPINPRHKTILDLNAPFQIRDEDLFTMAKSSAFNGLRGKGIVKETYIRDQLIYADGKIVGPQLGRPI